MKAVGLRELKNRLSEYVRLVKAGDTVLVTDRGQVVAELKPPGTAAAETGIPPGLMDLIRRGEATPGAGPSDYKHPRLPRLAPDGTAQRLIDEERGVR